MGERFTYYILNNEEAILNINNIFYNKDFNFYYKNKEEYSKETVELFLDNLLGAFEYSFYYKIDINQNKCPPKLAFSIANDTFSFAENSLEEFEEKVNISFVNEYEDMLTNFKKSILNRISEEKYDTYNEWNTWNKKEQEDFQKALNIRLTAFCSNIGLAQKVNITINYITVRRDNISKGFLGQIKETFNESPFVTIVFSPMIAVECVVNMYESLKRNISNSQYQ